jgi:hypothetical protein
MREQNFKIVYADSMVEPFNIRTRYASRKCAQNAADRMNAKLDRRGSGGSRYAVYSLEEYAKAVKGKGEWKTSPFTGRKVWVALGTPACCDPTTETYMSM